MSTCISIKRDKKPCRMTTINPNGRCEFHQGLDFYLQTKERKQCMTIKCNGVQCKIIGVEPNGSCIFHQVKTKQQYRNVLTTKCNGDGDGNGNDIEPNYSCQRDDPYDMNDFFDGSDGDLYDDHPNYPH